MRRFAFWTSAATIVYTYVLFPVLVVIRGLVAPQPIRQAAIEPKVTLLIAARNEADALPAKLANIADLDYPRARLQVVVVSDGSTDGTTDILRAFERSGGLAIEVLDLPPSGKAAALNAAVGLAEGEVFVFSDANSLYAPDALRALLRRLADPAVGGVAGNQVYSHAGTADAAGERGYWGFDRLLKEFESRAGNTIGGTGAMYAIRRELFRPIPPGVNDDFYETAGVVDQGRRLVFAADAVTIEPPAPDIGSEYDRKVRVISRAVRCVAAMPRLLDPRRSGFYAVQLASHKVLRWSMGIPLATLLVSSATLARTSAFHTVAFAAQVAAYGLAVIGLAAPRSRTIAGPLVSVPAYFVMINAAAMRALVGVLRGQVIDRWDRAAPVPATAPADVRQPPAIDSSGLPPDVLDGRDA